MLAQPAILAAGITLLDIGFKVCNYNFSFPVQNQIMLPLSLL